jgi:uroporphyrinogen decarboxylase
MNYSPHRFIRALLRQPVDKTPIWIMRQAGRYLPEYRALRAKAGDFLTLCKTPELACEATLQPLARFGLDAAILFSDILTIPDAMGLGLYFSEGEGPRFKNPIRTMKDVAAIEVPDPEIHLRYVCDTVRLCRRELNNKVPLIGFSGSPWTLATYMVEGGASKDFRLIKNLLFREPEMLHALLEKLASAVAQYLIAQIAAGVQTVMIFDTWGGVLTTRDYENFSLGYMKKIIAEVKAFTDKNEIIIPVILFTKSGGQWIEAIADSGCDAVGIDWTINIADARKRIGNRVAIQGNLDPATLYADPRRIHQEVNELLESFGKGSGHIFNLGHGIAQDVSPDNVKVLVDAVHELSQKFHS